jgi:hypothetical protein
MARPTVIGFATPVRTKPAAIVTCSGAIDEASMAEEAFGWSSVSQLPSGNSVYQHAVADFGSQA